MAKWKSHLLSTGIPLEHEIYQVLDQRNFFVRPEYEYTRLSEGQDKDFSVDIDATFYSEIEDRIRYQVNTLIECKYRSRDKTILVFEDANENLRATLGCTIACIDELDSRHWRKSHVYDFERGLPFIFNAVEVSEGGAHSNELRRGFNQLLYAAPEYLPDHLQFSLDGHVVDVTPQVFMRFLVTNAPLRIVKRGISLTDIENAKDLSDISSSIPAAIMVQNTGPDFKRHVSSLAEKYDRTSLKVSAERIQQAFEESGKDYSRRYDHLTRFVDDMFGGAWRMRSFCTQHFIVSQDAFLPFLTSAMRTVGKAYSRRTLKPR